MSKSTIVFIISVVMIPVAVFSLAYFFSRTLNDDINALMSVVEQIDNAINSGGTDDFDVKKVVPFIEKLNEKWKKCSDRWCFFFDHEEIHNIQMIIAELEKEVESGNYYAATVSTARIKCSLELLSKHDALDLSNFF